MEIAKTTLKYLFTLFLPIFLLVMLANALGITLLKAQNTDFDLTNSYFGFMSFYNCFNDISSNFTLNLQNFISFLTRLVSDMGLGVPDLFVELNANNIANVVFNVLFGPLMIFIDVTTVLGYLIFIIVDLLQPLFRLFMGYYNLPILNVGLNIDNIVPLV